ncbi:MAG: GNVR domain-containing protein [Deltaproteobacteria bacterium]|nr:GNVR domain-containing protein [Deltaproteobacteria bacterium]
MNGNNRYGNGEYIDLFDYWRVIARRKRLILYVSSAVFVLSIVLSLLLPRYYAATASVMPPQQEDPLNAGIISRLTGGAGALAGGFLGVKSPADLWVGILKSRSVTDSIIDRFGLRELYGAKTIEETREKLGRFVSISKSREEIVSVTVEDKDPERAARMANAFIEELDRINRGAVMTSGGRTRAFIEKRLEEARAGLLTAEGSLKAFKERNKAVKLDEQSKAIIEAIGTVKGQLMAKEVALQTLLSYAAPTNPQVELLKAEAKGLEEKLVELEKGKTRGRGGPARDIFIPTNRMPDISFRYAGLVRDAKVQEALFELLTQQYEMARIQEAKDSPTVQVLDGARQPEKKSRPKRAAIVALLTAVGFLSSVFLAFLLEYIEGASKN